MSTNVSASPPPPSFVKILTDLIYSIAFYSPLAVVMSVMYWGFSVGGSAKSFAYLLLVVAIICVRTIGFACVSAAPAKIPQGVCGSAVILPNDPLYSVFLLSFTLFYLLLPMFLSGSYNFGAIGFFGSYLVVDLGVRLSLKCVDGVPALLQGLLGAMVGSMCGGLYYTYARSLVFVNVVNTSSGEVCTMPSAQQFKCSVYKNGELVSSG